MVLYTRSPKPPQKTMSKYTSILKAVTGTRAATGVARARGVRNRRKNGLAPRLCRFGAVVERGRCYPVDGVHVGENGNVGSGSLPHRLLLLAV